MLRDSAIDKLRAEDPLTFFDAHHNSVMLEIQLAEAVAQGLTEPRCNDLGLWV